MTPCFHPRLVNGPFQDPVLYIDFLYQSRALLFDIGDISTLSPRQVHKITDIFVSHTHMDHFIGLDQVIRLCLGREKRLNIYGPPNIIKNVDGKLSAYTWNLVTNYENRFEIQVMEFHSNYLERALFRCQNVFRKEPLPQLATFEGVLLAEEEFSIHGIRLNHFTPCLAFCMNENSHINIKKDRLDIFGFSPGPWLRELKKAIREGRADDYPIDIFSRKSDGLNSQQKTLGWIKEADLFNITNGQKIAYIVDIGYTPENLTDLIPFIKGADYLFCEAAFLEEDREIAEKKGHLTAHQAGLIARDADVRKLIPFHFSPRYQERSHLLYREAEGTFKSKCNI